MIKTIAAYTTEVDDKDYAVAEILEQLDLKHGLLKNSVGIITGYREFIVTGIVKAISEALPFDVVGISTMSVAVNGDCDQMLLGVMVLTSDDVRFSTGLSAQLADDSQPIYDLFQTAAKALPEKPSLILTLSAILPQLGGDAIIQHLDAASGGIPIFGSLAIDFDASLRDPRLIFNGESYDDRMAVILLSGNFTPEFSVVAISKDKMLSQTGHITKSQGPLLIEVNEMPVMRYFESLALTKNGEFLGISSQIPLIIDSNDGIGPVTRSILAKNGENNLLCGGSMPEGCTLSIGSLDMADILKTSSLQAEKLAGKESDGILLFSCVSRLFALGLNTKAEMKTVMHKLNTRFLLAYSGGEICPVFDKDGNLKNRFHNMSFISCSFR